MPDESSRPTDEERAKAAADLTSLSRELFLVVQQALIKLLGNDVASRLGVILTIGTLGASEALDDSMHILGNAANMPHREQLRMLRKLITHCEAEVRKGSGNPNPN